LPERALECPQCRGIWLPRSIIDAWRNHPFVEVDDGSMPSIPPDDLRTGLCPLGHGILIRARVEADRVFHLERCGTCRGIWLDKGEWQRLAAARFLDHLDDLWDPNWQKRQRAQHSRQELDAALRDRLGPDLFNGLSSTIEEVARHPARAQVLAWIIERLK
jgi:Zn-finger nucleic acid-binding protein